ncbi:MAG TPA: alanine racemase [Candidatus Limnocylindrales bacterium]|nr:alanine racemase [Candidatus Limnocylindrales bacterium]
MLLEFTLKRNPALVDAAVELHRAGRIPPDTFVLDLDAVEGNARILADAAEHLGLHLYFVSKQFGRNPMAIAAVARYIPRATAIDIREAARLHQSGAGLGNVGHLVQVPNAAIEPLLRWSPAVVTVFSYAKAEAVSRAASSLGMVQPILLRVCGERDHFFAGQEGGIPLEDAVATARRIRDQLPGVRVEGVTSFPCLLFDAARETFCATPNLQTLREAKAALEQAGIPVAQVNAPSGSCVATLPELVRLGATHGEPGHALTGSTPLHAVDHEQPELPAMVYLSEVSHTLPDGRVAIYGGGFYRRGHPRTGLVFSHGNPPLRLGVEDLDPTQIDYYRFLQPGAGSNRISVGDPVVLAFRTQVFVTRSNVAVLRHSDLRPQLLGLFDPFGRPL